MSESMFECQNCGKAYRQEQLKTSFPDIPDLAQRVSPGELVPAGECNACGSLVHERLGKFSSDKDVVKFTCGDDQVVCRNDRGRIVQLGVVHDGHAFEETDLVQVIHVDELSARMAFGDEWTFSQVFDGLSDGIVTLDRGIFLKGKMKGRK